MTGVQTCALPISLRQSYREGPQWADEYLYGLLAQDWRGRRADFAGVR